MTYLNQQALDSITTEAFNNARLFPWTNPKGLIDDTGFNDLLRTMPDVSLFEKSIGMSRAYGQKPHDRYELKYKEDAPVSKEWQMFIEELSGPRYRAWLARLLGTNDFNLRYQWQYSFNGCSVSPHCDSPNKLGSHIFYFNTPEDWKLEWGGQTLLLDDGGKFPPQSAPDLSEFKGKLAADVFDNRSLFFKRTDRSWHAVSELTSPKDAMRKIFTVIIERKPTLWQKIQAKLKSFFSAA